jgi:hypothetical protein
MMTLMQMIEQKQFSRPDGSRAIPVNDVLEWLLVNAVAGTVTIAPGAIDGGAPCSTK